MKVFAAIQLLVTLLTTATATDSLRGARELPVTEGEALSSSTRQITEFPQIKLTMANQKTPFIGVPYAAGIAAVRLDYDSSRASTKKWQVCIETNVIGFIPGALSIDKAKISANGVLKVNFTSYLTSDPTFDRCVSVAQDVFNDMRDNSEFFYVNVRVATWPTALSNRGIRGQFIQGFTANADAEQEVDSFHGNTAATGVATISVEGGGTVLCIDATIKGMDPVLAHFHNGKKGQQGDVEVDFSSKKVSPGRYLGCITISPSEAFTADLAAKILDNPSQYYIQFHQGKQGSSNFYKSIRGQLA